MSGIENSKFVDHPLVWPNTLKFRLYQQSIAAVASKKNTLVILPTALGKTIIAVLVSAEMLYRNRDIKILMMAPTRPLLVQHQRTFMDALKLRKNDVVLLTGKIAPSDRSLIWHQNARLFFSTPQVVRNDLVHNRLNLESFGLLVVDESHRAVGNYAYTAVAKKYVSQARYPILLAMTASPGADRKRILEICRNLFIEHVEYRNEDDSDVKPYIHPITLAWNYVDLPRTYRTLATYLRTILNRRLHRLYLQKIIDRHPRYATRTMLIEAGNRLRASLQESGPDEKRRIFSAILNQALGLTLFHMLELVETQGRHAILSFLNKIEQEKNEKRSYSLLINEPEYPHIKSLVESQLPEHPKIALLNTIVTTQIHDNPASRILVFTQYRNTANHLVYILNLIPTITALPFVGQSTSRTDKGLTQEQQADRISQLREGQLNVLVSTSIGEEGLDIPEVDLVVFYEPIPSGIRYIQRRGRTGRKAPGKVTILATNDTLDTVYLRTSQKRTQKMRKIAQNLNKQLHPIIRNTSKPLINPLTTAELDELEQETPPVTLKSPLPEIETIRSLKKRVERTKKLVYLHLLEFDATGISLNQLLSDLNLDHIAKSVIVKALDELIKQNRIVQVKPNFYATVPSMHSENGQTYDVEILKIQEGSAIVLINDSWRATLTPDNYQGPRQLIKKYVRFRAIASFTRIAGVLYIRIKDVLQIFS
jgi:Fanconi anemia group M protein